MLLYAPGAGSSGSESRRETAAPLLNRRRALRWIGATAVALGFGWRGEERRAAAAQQITSGTGSRQARQHAIKSLPLEKLSDADRARVSRVVDHASVYRHLPTQVIRCEPNLYLFLVEHPEVVVNVWQVLGVSGITIDRTGPQTFRADDKAGTLGEAELLYRSHDRHLLYSRGTYEGSLFTRKVRGECVLALGSDYIREPDGRDYVTCRMDAFVKIENLGVDILSRTFQPLVGAVADHNFREVTGFLEMLSHTAEINHPGMLALAQRLTNIDEATQARFGELCEGAAVSAALVERNEPQIREADATARRRETSETRTR